MNLKRETISQAILRNLKRLALATEDPNQWWADVLNYTRGNVGIIIETLEENNLPFKDYPAAYKALREGSL